MAVLTNTLRTFIQGFMRLPQQEIDAPQRGLQARIQRAYNFAVDSCFIPAYLAKRFCFGIKLRFSGINIRNLRNNELDNLSFRDKFRTLQNASLIAQSLIRAHSRLNPRRDHGGYIDAGLITRIAQGNQDAVNILTNQIASLEEILRPVRATRTPPAQVSNCFRMFLEQPENQRETFISFFSRFNDPEGITTTISSYYLNRFNIPIEELSEIVTELCGEPQVEHPLGILPDLDSEDASFIRTIINLNWHTRARARTAYNLAITEIINPSKEEKKQLFSSILETIPAEEPIDNPLQARVRRGIH